MGRIARAMARLLEENAHLREAATESDDAGRRVCERLQKSQATVTELQRQLADAQARLLERQNDRPQLYVLATDGAEVLADKALVDELVKLREICRVYNPSPRECNPPPAAVQPDSSKPFLSAETIREAKQILDSAPRAAAWDFLEPRPVQTGGHDG